jgi:hypothetical protein
MSQTMEGIHFVTDQSGEKVAVQLDLARYGDLWDDVYDQITAKQRSREKRESSATVKKRLVSQGKLRG